MIGPARTLGVVRLDQLLLVDANFRCMLLERAQLHVAELFLQLCHVLRLLVG